MRRIVIIASSAIAAGVIALAVFFSAQSLAPQPAPGGGTDGTSSCAPRDPAEGTADADAAEEDREPCGDTTGKPGEVKP
jgi:hypothetical protein